MGTNQEFKTVQCNHCVEPIAEDEEPHVKIVKPIEFKGETQKITHYYCSVDCLLEKLKQ